MKTELANYLNAETEKLKEEQRKESLRNNPPILFKSAFPLRVEYSVENGSWQIWTNQDNRPGNRNNFVVCGEIQLYSEAEFIVNAINKAAGF
jgi:hypothetical protein